MGFRGASVIAAAALAATLAAHAQQDDRLRVAIDPAATSTTAWALAEALAAGDPPVIVRDHEVEHGHFFLDPCNLHEGEAKIVADRILAGARRARASGRPGATSAAERRVRRFERLLRWPD